MRQQPEERLPPLAVQRAGARNVGGSGRCWRGWWAFGAAFSILAVVTVALLVVGTQSSGTASSSGASTVPATCGDAGGNSGGASGAYDGPGQWVLTTSATTSASRTASRAFSYSGTTSGTASISLAASASRSSAITGSASIAASYSAAATVTATGTSAASAFATLTGSSSAIATATATMSASLAASASGTRTGTACQTATASGTASRTRSGTGTATLSATASATATATVSASVPAFAPLTSATRVGDGWGVNTHFLWEEPGEMAMLSAAFKVIRTDMTWAAVEGSSTPCGRYDFYDYDNFFSLLRQYRMRGYVILGYSNGCYSNVSVPGCASDVCIAGYSNFSRAAMQRYSGNGTMWETVNEPDLPFMGNNDANTTAKLAAAAATWTKPLGETLIGPASANGAPTSPYLSDVLAAGALRSYNGWSVHAYRAGGPEGSIADFLALRRLVNSYAAAQGVPTIPVLSGEWGYTSAKPPCNYGQRYEPVTHGKFLPRMWLSNLAAGVSLSIWYDWRDDGIDGTSCEANFGTVYFSSSGNAAAPFKPKPAYRAALAVQTSVGNASSFNGRLPTGAVAVTAAPPDVNASAATDVFVLAFSGGPGLGSRAGGVSFAAWTNITTCAAPTWPGARQPCARAPNATGLTPADIDACALAGCCWDWNVNATTLAAGALACYSAPTPSTPRYTCPTLSAASEKVDCGYFGISFAGCMSRGCCWDSSSSIQGPQCYRAAAAGAINVTVVLPPSVAPGSCFAVRDTFGTARGDVCAAAASSADAAAGSAAYSSAAPALRGASPGPLAAVSLQLTDGPLYLY